MIDIHWLNVINPTSMADVISVYKFGVSEIDQHVKASWPECWRIKQTFGFLTFAYPLQFKCLVFKRNRTGHLEYWPRYHDYSFTSWKNYTINIFWTSYYWFSYHSSISTDQEKSTSGNKTIWWIHMAKTTSDWLTLYVKRRDIGTFLHDIYGCELTWVSNLPLYGGD